MAEPNRSHLRNGGIFIGICALIGLGLFLFDQVRSAVGEAGVSVAATPTPTPAPLAASPAMPADVTPNQDATPVDTEADPAAKADGMATGQLDATPNSGSLDDRARVFVDDYYRMASADPDTAIAWMNGHYADQVDFFGKPTTRASIIRQKQDYLQRWPSREYRLDPGAAVNNCDPATSLCRLSGVITFKAGSAERGATSSGTAAFEMTIDFSGGTPAILRETSRVTSRG